MLAPWPGFLEVNGNTGIIGYIEFVGEYSPLDLHDLENIFRVIELYDMSSMFKVGQEPNEFFSLKTS